MYPGTTGGSVDPVLGRHSSGHDGDRRAIRRRAVPAVHRRRACPPTPARLPVPGRLRSDDVVAGARRGRGRRCGAGRSVRRHPPGRRGLRRPRPRGRQLTSADGSPPSGSTASSSTAGSRCSTPATPGPPTSIWTPSSLAGSSGAPWSGWTAAPTAWSTRGSGPRPSLGSLTHRSASLREKAALAAFSLRAGYSPVDRLLAAPERSAEEALRHAGVGDAGPGALLPPVPRRRAAGGRPRHLQPLPRPALALLRPRRDRPARRRHAVGRPAARRPARPTGGSTSAPGAARSPPARCASTAERCTRRRRRRRHRPGRGRRPASRSGRRRAAAGDHPPPRAARVPLAMPLIVLGQPGGRLVNSAVVSDAQPRYSPDGRALVASSTLAPDARAGRPRAEIASGARRRPRRAATSPRHRDRRPAGRSATAAAAPAGRAGRRPVRLRRPPRHPVHPGRHGQRCPRGARGPALAAPLRPPRPGAA